MSGRVRSAGAATERAPVAPATLVATLLIALCALLLLKWIAVVALVALGLGALVWWARRGPTASAPVPAVHYRDDCSWCGRAGGHRDGSGRLRRPRHVHDLR